MYNEINTNQLKKAGQYVLSDVVLTSFQSSEGRNEPKKISIRSLVTEINIYESLNNKVLSGNITEIVGLTETDGISVFSKSSRVKI